MKKLVKNKIFLAIAAVILISGSGFAFVKNQKKEAPAVPTQNTKEDQGVGTTNEKGDLPDTSATPSQETKSDPTTPTANTAVSNLSDVTLTVYLNSDNNTISPYFYPTTGIYTAQKLSGSNWVDVASNINYPGHGGIAAAAASATEDNISYRLLKIEGGRTSAVSKTFAVKRSDLNAGTASYN